MTDVSVELDARIVIVCQLLESARVAVAHPRCHMCASTFVGKVLTDPSGFTSSKIMLTTSIRGTSVEIETTRAVAENRMGLKKVALYPRFGQSSDRKDVHC